MNNFNHFTVMHFKMGIWTLLLYTWQTWELNLKKKQYLAHGLIFIILESFNLIDQLRAGPTRLKYK
jgi:hypothetical protein